MKTNPPDKIFNFGYDVIDKYAILTPENIAIEWSKNNDEKLKISYEELSHHSNISASYFEKIGIKSGEKVIILVEDTVEFWIILIALHKLWAIAIPLNPSMLNKNELLSICSSLKPDYLITANTPSLILNSETLKAQNDSIKRMILIGATKFDWEDFYAGKRQAKAFYQNPSIIHAKETALITYSKSKKIAMKKHDFYYPLTLTTTTATNIIDRFYVTLLTGGTFKQHDGNSL